MSYFVKIPRWLRKLYGNYTWDLPAQEKVVYLTFDDGPDETVTPFILDSLKAHGAKASFFCIGKNAEQHSALLQRILAEGHSLGSHTWNHSVGWLTKNDEYYRDVTAAAALVKTNLFRPPFGRLTPRQGRVLQKQMGLDLVMWSITSGDFDSNLSPERCLNNVLKHVYPGAIVLLHDNLKAAVNLRFVLPKLLAELMNNGYRFAALPMKQKRFNVPEEQQGSF